MQDIIETRKYLELQYELKQYHNNLNSLKIDILGSEESFGYKVKNTIRSIIMFVWGGFMA